jgi:hypothetical protein
MKKKLLFTMGCSYTEGVGCYDMNYINHMIKKNPEYQDITRHFDIYENSKKRFRENGWPANLQKKLNYDVLINMGKRATANSQHLKVFIEKYGDKNLSDEYDVLVIWLMTHPSRFSFYNEYMVRTILNNFISGDAAIDNLSDAVVNWIKDPHYNFLLEHLYEVRTMKLLCDRFNYKFLVGSLSEYASDFFDKVYPGIQDYNLNYYIKKLKGDDMTLLPPSKNEAPEYWSTICLHPNELGYEVLAQNMYYVIQNVFPEYISNRSPKKFELIYDGEPIDWSSKIYG